MPSTTYDVVRVTNPINVATTTGTANAQNGQYLVTFGKGVFPVVLDAYQLAALTGHKIDEDDDRDRVRPLEALELKERAELNAKIDEVPWMQALAEKYPSDVEAAEKEAAKEEEKAAKDEEKQAAKDEKGADKAPSAPASSSTAKEAYKAPSGFSTTKGK